MGHLDDSIMNEVNAAIAVSFGLGQTMGTEHASAMGDTGAFPFEMT